MKKLLTLTFTMTFFTFCFAQNTDSENLQTKELKLENKVVKKTKAINPAIKVNSPQNAILNNQEVSYKSKVAKKESTETIKIEKNNEDLIIKEEIPEQKKD